MAYTSTVTPVTVYTQGMSRPKTKGEPISLRFPITADAKLRALAEARSMTPAEYLVSRILPALETNT